MAWVRLRVVCSYDIHLVSPAREAKTLKLAGEQPAAGPSNGSDRLVAIARIVRPQGRQGEVAAEILTDFPERFGTLREALLEHPGKEPDPVIVQSSWLHKGRIILKFAGIDSISEANRLRELHVLIPSEERAPLPAGHYYVGDLTGCQVVVERDGRLVQVGKVTGVEPTGGVDLLHVTTAGGRGAKVLIPLAQAICKRIDPEAKTIVIDPPEDLLDLNL